MFSASLSSKFKNRKPMACIVCRERRVKCDYAKPRCRRCQTANRFCSYRESSVLISGDEIRELTRCFYQLETKLASLESLYEHTIENLQAAHLQRLLDVLCRHPWIISPMPDNKLRIDTGYKCVTDLHRFLCPYDITQLARERESAAPSSFSHDALELTLSLLEIGSPCVPQVRPEVVDQLLEVYFLCFHPFCPLLHKSSFLHSSNDPAYHASLYAICAYVARHATYLHGLPGREKLGDQFYLLAREELFECFDLEEASPCLAYAFIFLSEFLFFDALRANQRYLFRGLALLIAQQLRSKPDDHVEQEVCRRLHWYLVVDHELEAGNTPMPSLLPDEAGDQRIREAILYWRACLELQAIEAEIDQQIYNREHGLFTTIDHLHERLEEWLHGLPPSLQTQGCTSLPLYAQGQYQLNLLKVHSAFLDPDAPEDRIENLRLIQHLLDTIKKILQQEPCNFPLAFISRVSDSVFKLWCLVAPHDPLRTRLNSIASRLRYLVVHSRHYSAKMPQVLRWIESFDEIVSKYRLEFGGSAREACLSTPI
ncbi:uncharacterized protein VTP21DRAFT_10160 [Calcarisporiella thermophila]|uniref:uncharacterized protein n=1 Tax=Calcarisporiella thermophila TaxID=911321 RepID=UPI0037424788